MRAVIDTNVLLSGLLWHGSPHSLIESARSGNLTLLSSSVLLAELTDVIGRAKFTSILTHSNTSREQLLAEVRQLSEIMEPAPLSEPVSRDPDDDHVLALAFAAQVDLIISGDHDLLSLKAFRGIPIVTPAEAVRIVAAG